jgi:hypothetical protein
VEKKLGLCGGPMKWDPTIILCESKCSHNYPAVPTVSAKQQRSVAGVSLLSLKALVGTPNFSVSLARQAHTSTKSSITSVSAGAVPFSTQPTCLQDACHFCKRMPAAEGMSLQRFRFPWSQKPMAAGLLMQPGWAVVEHMTVFEDPPSRSARLGVSQAGI